MSFTILVTAVLAVQTPAAAPGDSSAYLDAEARRLVAAGRGHRLGGGIPKQYVLLGGVCALRRCVDAFLSHAAVGRLQIVIHPDDRALCDAALRGLSDPRLLPPTPPAGWASERSSSPL